MSRCLQCIGVHCPDQQPRSCGVDGVHHPHSAAGDQGVGDAHWTSRLRCCPVGVCEKGTRSRIPSINETLLLVHCFSTCVPLLQSPQTVSGGGIRTSSHRWFVAAEHLAMDTSVLLNEVQDAATLPLWLGLRSAWRSRVAADWASWADCLPMIHARHPHVAAELLEQRL